MSILNKLNGFINEGIDKASALSKSDIATKCMSQARTTVQKGREQISMTDLSEAKGLINKAKAGIESAVSKEQKMQPVNKEAEGCPDKE